MRSALPVLILSVLLATASADAARAAWADVKDEQEIFAIVHDEDGKPREVKIWIVVLEDNAYIRTRNTSWRADLERDSNLRLKIAGKEIAVRPVPVKDPETYERVNEAYTEKYGVSPHIVLAIMRPFLGPWNIYRVEER
jgi:hypothetical protein